MSTRSKILMLLAVHLAFPAGGSADEPPKTVADLKWEVERREHDVAEAQCELAKARARLALAQRRPEVAAAELRKVVSYYEKELKRAGDILATIEDNPRLCPPDTSEFRLARNELRNAQIELALAEGKPESAVRQLEQALAEKEAWVRVLRSLVQRRFVGSENLASPEADLAKLRARLEVARKAVKTKSKVR
jgi:hypothetical protein